MINWWNTDIGENERSYLNKAFSEKRFSCGTYVREFEERIENQMNISHAIVTPSGTATLMMSLLALEVGPGDEIIIPDMTWIATAQAASVLGAKVILVDSEDEQPIFDINDLEKKFVQENKSSYSGPLPWSNGNMERVISIKGEIRVFNCRGCM